MSWPAAAIDAHGRVCPGMTSPVHVHGECAGRVRQPRQDRRPSVRDLRAGVMTRIAVPSRLELEHVLVAEHGVSSQFLGACSASTTYSEALRIGLITEAQYDAARARSGRLWNYCGD